MKSESRILVQSAPTPKQIEKNELKRCSWQKKSGEVD
jgi:hypothetical protein